MSDDCPICHGTGFAVRTATGGVAVGAPCACSREEAGQRLLRGARIPRRYDHCSFENFLLPPQDGGHGEAKRIAREWVERWPAVVQGLLFHGPPGTGKTHLAVAIARELVQSRRARLLFCEQRDLLKSIQGTFDPGAALREVEVLGPVLEVEVLVLDDLGAGRTTPWARDVLHDVIAQRYNEERPMILTTNLELGDPDKSPSVRPLDAPLTLRDRLGDPLTSRLYEMCRLVPLRGDDYRVAHARASMGPETH